MSEFKVDDIVDTKFGMVKIMSIDKGRIAVLIDGDITATFNLKEFGEFVL